MAEEPSRWQRIKTAPGRFRRWFPSRYMDADLRTLGLWRIVIGLFICIDTFRHALEARFYYSNDGVFQNHWHLFSPTAEFNVSLFTSLSTPTAVRLGFAFAIICAFCFAIGFKTRAFNILVCVMTVSLDQRLLLRENGGYVVEILLTFWTIFLPMGERFSVDSWRRGWRRSRGRSPEAAATLRRDLPRRRHRSLASAIVLLNFAVIYLFNVVNKFGATWMKGHTVHYVLHIDRMVTPLAVFFRERLPFEATRAITWSVLVVEAVIMLGIVWPNNRRFTRILSMLLLVPLHTTFGTMMRLGPFSWAMICWSVVLLCPVHWEALGRRFVARVPTATLTYAGAFGAAVARALALLDHHDRLEISRRGEGPALRVGDAEGRAAFWRALSLTPAGRVLGPIARLFSLGVVDVLAAWAFARPRGWARFWGWREPTTDAPIAVVPDPPRWTSRQLGRLREALLVVLLLFETSQMINENKSLPKPLKHQQPKAVRAIVGYPRIFQGWGMFAPNPIREDGVVAIDAITVDGRHIDPLRIIAGQAPEPDLNLSDDRGSGYNQIHQDYQNRIRLNQNQHHRTGLKRMLWAWHERTGRPEDEIVHFDVYWVRDENPRPGETEPRNLGKRCLASWRKRGVSRVMVNGEPQRLPRACTPVKEKDDEKKKTPANVPPWVRGVVRWWQGE